MSSKDGEVYIMSGEGDEGWVHPTPLPAAIVEAVTAGTDLGVDDIDDVEAYVDLAAVRSLFSNEDADPVTFQVEGHEVTVDADGDIQVAE